jgi:predicted kinase
LVVLAGPVASGKSTWAATHFPPSAVISSDALRGVVGAGEDDIAASADAFALLDEIVARRVARGLTTVVDTTGMDADRRARSRTLARAHGMACVAVAVDTAASVCRARNRARPHPVPATALTAQLRAWPAVRDALDGEGFDQVLRPEPVRVVPKTFAHSDEAAERQRAEPVGLRFALHLSRAARVHTKEDEMSKARRFILAAAVLPDDTYTVTLKSGIAGNGFFDLLGASLDGANNAGHADYTNTFTTHYQANATPVLAVPDFARGPDDDHAVKVPNDKGHGIPITLYNATGITDATFTLTYNPTVLAVTGAGTGDSSGASTFTLASSTANTATFTFHNTSPVFASMA